MSDRTMRSDLGHANPSWTKVSQGDLSWGQESSASANHEPTRPPKVPQGDRPATTTVHPVVIELGLGAVVWFLAVAWLDFAWGRHVDFDLVVVTGFFFVFFMVLLLASSLSPTILDGVSQR
jgi:hypothetical protein